MILYQRIRSLAQEVQGTRNIVYPFEGLVSTPVILLLKSRVATGFITEAHRQSWFTLHRDMLMVQQSLPLLHHPFGIQPFEAVARTNPHLTPAHFTLYGASLMLNTIRYNEDFAAQAAAYEAAKALADLAKQIRGPRKLTRLQVYRQFIVRVFPMLAHYESSNTTILTWLSLSDSYTQCGSLFCTRAQ